MPLALKPVIYQLVVRYFGNTNSTRERDGSLAINGCGRFSDINRLAIDSLRQLGITHIWLTGCLRQATLTDHTAIGLPPDNPNIVKGIAGSFYAIRDYYDVCPDYADDPHQRLAEFEALLVRIHDAGLKVMIDFVGNHVARSYQSTVRPIDSLGAGDDAAQFFSRNNHFFYLVDPPGQSLRLTRGDNWSPARIVFDGRFEPEDGGPGRPPKVTGNNVCSAAPSETDWYETVKLNYGYNFVEQTGHYSPMPRTWRMMNDILAYWQGKGVDGFRCDFAHYIPPEAWAFLIAQARVRNPIAFFVAEAYPFANSGDPITDRAQLLTAGFDAVYHDESYNQLKRIYQGVGSQQAYEESVRGLSPEIRNSAIEYLENHDERRIASPVATNTWTGNSGFGSSHAGYQLAPLQFLCSPGPVLLLNGQELGEPGDGIAGFARENGRTTVFDYWSMPEVVRWVRDHKYDEAGLTVVQKHLRHFYSDLLALCQHPCVKGDAYWGLKYFNSPEQFGDCSDGLYSFARFRTGGKAILLVAANFSAGHTTSGRLRIPEPLAQQAALPPEVAVQLLLDRDGAQEKFVLTTSADSLVRAGFVVTIPDQSAHVYVLQ